MAFPDTPLPLQVDISLDGTTWTNITTDVRAQEQIHITRGRSDWAQQVDFGRCSLVLSNNDGRYSPRNPSGPYYGQIGRNTPLRVSVNTGSVALDLPGADGDYASTPDAVPLDITGDLDVRLDATFLNWCLPEYPFSGASDFERTELIGKSSAGQTSWVLYGRLGTLYLRWSTDGSTLNGASATQDLPLTTSGRLAVRATLDVDNGAGGWTATFYTSDSISGTWTQLGDPVTGTGVTSIFSGTATLRIGSIPDVGYNTAIGHVHAAQVYNGIGGTLVANPDFTAQTTGTTSFADSAGRTWSVAGNATITNRKVRFLGEIASWTPRWTTGGFDVVTDIEAAGVLRRLGIGAVPVKSPFYREFTTSGRMAAGIVAYWPMEDGSTATSLASAYSGHPAMTITGAVTPAAYADWVASDAIPTVDTGSLRVVVPAYTLDSSSTGKVGFFTKVPAAGVTSTQRLISFSQTGSTATWSMYVNSAGNVAFRAYDINGTQLYDSGFITSVVLNGMEAYFTLYVAQSGSDVTYNVTVVDIAQSMLTAVPDNAPYTITFNGTVTAQTTGRITQVRFGEDGAMNGTAFGHLAVGNTGFSFQASAGVMVGWNAEEGASRAARIGAEENLNAFATGAGDEQCGPQPRGTALDILRAAGDVDEGILAEQRSILGLRYVTRASMYNQPPALTLSYSGSDGLVAPLDPADDDQHVTNDVTVARTSGASGRATLTSGSLSTQAPPNGVGLYDTSYTLNLLDDTQPVQHANWRLHIGSWDETRYPQVSVNLANAPSSIENAAAVDVGSRMQITNPPAWLPPGTIDLRVEGYTETMDQYTWTLVYNCSPHGPWNVAYESDSAYGRADTDGSTLAAAATSTATSLTVLTQAGSSPWTTDVAGLPFDVSIGGETVQVEPAGTVLTTNPSFETDTSGWTPTSATLTRSSAVHRVGSWSGLLTTAAGSNPRAEDDMRAVTAGSTYTAMGWLYAPSALPQVAGINVNWYDASRAYLSTSANTTTLKTAVWTPFNAQFTAPVGAAYAGVLFTVANTPGAGYLLYADNVKLISGASGITSWLKDTFTRTVANGWGTPDIGAAWAVTGGAASDYAVGSGYGSATLTSVNVSRNTTVAAIHPDSDTYCDITTSALATGDSLYGAVVARMVDTSNRYLARVEFTTSNAIVLTVQKSVAGTQTQLGTYTLSLTHVAGTFIRVRFQLSGTTVRAKAWLATSMEPNSWAIEVTDTSFAAAGLIGTRSISGPANTNVSPQIRYENLETVNPQVFAVSRSVNGVVKAQSAGADVRLTTPAYIAL